jgi:hypothetical protein
VVAQLDPECGNVNDFAVDGVLRRHSGRFALASQTEVRTELPPAGSITRLGFARIAVVFNGF